MVVTSSHKPQLRALFASELQQLYAFAYLMLCSRSEARRAVDASARRLLAEPAHAAELLAEPNPNGALLGVIARDLDARLGRKAGRTFKVLDDILRSELTRPVDPSYSDPDKLHALLWELKRTCLTSVLSCLPPGVRMAFILTDLMNFQPGPAAGLLKIKESAYRVRLTRARKRIEDYLTPRCQHVDVGNPCNCEGRLAISLDKRFLRPPPHTKDIPEEPFDARSPHGTVMPLYRTLPAVQLSNSRSQELLALFD